MNKSKQIEILQDVIKDLKKDINTQDKTILAMRKEKEMFQESIKNLQFRSDLHTQICESYERQIESKNEMSRFKDQMLEILL